MPDRPTNAELQQRIQALEALLSQGNAALYHNIMAALPDIIVRLDLHGTVLEVNEAGLEFSGYTPADLQGKSMLEFIAPQDRERILQNTLRMFQEKLGPQTYHLILKDGRQAPFEVNGDVLRDAEGNPVGIIQVCRDIAERVQAEEALHQAEERYRSVIENSHDGIIIVDDDHKFLYVNHQFGQIVGYPPEDLLGRDFREILAPETSALVDEHYKLRQAGHSPPSRYEFLILRPDGEKRWVETSSSIVVDSRGRRQTVAQLMDTTERKQAEEVRRLHTERLEALLALNQMPGASLDELAAFSLEEAVRLTRSQIGYVAFANEDESVLTMYAWSRAAMTGCAIQDKPLRYPVRDTGLWGEAVRQRRPVITNDYQAPNPLKKGTPPGHVAIQRHMNVPIFDGDKIVIVAGVGNKEAPYEESDSTQLTLLMQGMWRIVRQKEAEEALKKSEERLETILKAMPDPVVVYDPQGIATFVNPAFTRVFGWQAEEVLGQRLPFVPEEEKEETFRVIRQLYDRGGPESFRTKRLTKAGKVLNIVISAAGVVDDAGKVTGMVVNLTDVTHTELLESQLRQSQKMEALGTLAGGIAHDFNNLLGVILGYADRVREHCRGRGKIDHEMSQIVNAASRAAELVQQILTFSRRGQTVMRPIDLNQAVEQVRGMLRRTIPKMVSIETSLCRDLELINCDQSQIELVLLNLANNAVDAMPEGGRLTITTRNTWLDETYCRPHPEVLTGPYVLLEVADSGAGMDEATMQHIFEPFYTTKEVGKGTGLGLSTVYGIVADHRGHITCTSAPGRGTIIRTFWPVYQGEPAAPQGDTDTAPRELSGSESILLVDDEDALREMAADVLEANGYRVASAASGEEALALYQKMARRPDLVILDLGMPGMGGHRCLKELLGLDPGAKVLIASGYGMDGVRDEALSGGAVGFLDKPFRLAELLGRVREVLDQG
ncbi:MAG: PAS domain S-box protein [Deltaproteobacteria bacterium]|nr:PAS domain S-box protein [Deltaproteobacteria bacterium]